jgi:hypothetical protein
LNRKENNVLYESPLRQEAKENNDVWWPPKKWLSN